MAVADEREQFECWMQAYDLPRNVGWEAWRAARIAILREMAEASRGPNNPPYTTNIDQSAYSRGRFDALAQIHRWRESKIKELIRKRRNA